MTDRTEQMVRLTSQARQQGGNAYRAQLPLEQNPFTPSPYYQSVSSLADELTDDAEGHKRRALACAWDAGWVVAAVAESINEQWSAANSLRQIGEGGA